MSFKPALLFYILFFLAFVVPERLSLFMPCSVNSVWSCMGVRFFKFRVRVLVAVYLIRPFCEMVLRA